MCFNPSVEGQPLQRVKVERITYLNGFQSLCRGTAIATASCPTLNGCRVDCFNPSIEGQPLQQNLMKLRWTDLKRFQSLYRGTAIATVMAKKAQERIYLFQSLCRGTAIATMN